MHLAVLLLVLLALPVPSASASSQRELGSLRSPNEMTSGGLLFSSAGGLHEAPALSTDVDIQINGLIARTRVVQRFSNPTTDWVEGVYVFPLPEDAAVDSLKITIGDSVIEGRIEERARAKATYKKAKAEGRKATLVEQERPNIFTTSIANLGPAEEVEVILTYQEEVQYDQGRFSMRFPMVIAPRYIPGTTKVAGFSGTGWADNTAEVTDAARITSPVVGPDISTAPPAQSESEPEPRRPLRLHPITIAVQIDAGFPLDEVESPSHAVRVQADRGNIYSVRLDAGAVPADSDFVLNWRPITSSAPRAALFRESWQGEDYALLMVLPPHPDAAKAARLSREAVIVIDTSGSMGGESIIQARRAVQHALITLRPEDTFNVIQFSSNFTALHPSSQPATTDAIKLASAWVDRLEAGGGTEMLPALEAALAPGREPRAVRQVIFITDGAVGNEAALFSVLQAKLGTARLYPVAIGSAPNAHFMTKAAKFGRGTFTYIGQPSEVSEKMSELFSKIDTPVLHDLRAHWDSDSVEAWPARIPDVYIGEPVLIAAKLPKEAKQIVLEGRRGTEKIRIELPLVGGSKHEGVAALWARRKIASLMNSIHEGESLDRVSVDVAALGVRHHLVTRWTSLVAVDVTPTAPPEVELDTRSVPSLLPRGWDFFGLFGPKQQGTSPPAPFQPRTRDPLHRTHQPTVAIGYFTTSSQIGRLPQGGTPSALLIWVGSGLLSGAGLVWRSTRRKVPKLLFRKGGQ
jgi:Ca-activated chloride channel family protein